jgi:hypothetical protein
MRFVLIGMLVASLLTGCSQAGTDSGSSAPAQAREAAAVDTAGEEGVPQDDPSIPRDDALGRTPEFAVTEVIDALNSRNWAKAYSLYATPTPNAEMAAKEWSEANETYTGFTVHETRVSDSETAQVRVTYTVEIAPAGQSPYTVTVDEPGEWWPLHKVEGTWKVGWMPRQ